MKRLRADRLLTEAGGFGADIRLHDMRSNQRVFWSPRGNSYVVMDRDSWGRREPIHRLTVCSINGIGEIRWTIPPDGEWTCGDSEAQLAIDYFFEEV